MPVIVNSDVSFTDFYRDRNSVSSADSNNGEHFHSHHHRKCDHIVEYIDNPSHSCDISFIYNVGRIVKPALRIIPLLSVFFWSGTAYRERFSTLLIIMSILFLLYRMKLIVRIVAFQILSTHSARWKLRIKQFMKKFGTKKHCGFIMLLIALRNIAIHLFIMSDMLSIGKALDVLKHGIQFIVYIRINHFG